MKTKVIYKERDANGVQVAIREIIYPISTWTDNFGTLTVYSAVETPQGPLRKAPIASYPAGEWVHAEDPDNENNPKPRR